MRSASLLAALLLSLLTITTSEKAHAGLFVSISVAPPALPVYVQPPVPGPGYIWTPGYWAWDEDGGDYYWVPGAWVLAPQPGLLWTPGYWGWRDGVYVWNAGYWGPHVGFYGGVCYGFGYTGVGFAGGAWSGGVFTYNRAVTNIGTSINVTNVYNKTVVVNNTTNVSFNGGNGGVQAQPNAQELAAANEHHMAATSEQIQHHQLAAKNPDLKFAKNQGKPAIAATSKAGDFSKGHTFAAKAAGSAVKPVSLKTQGNRGGKPGDAMTNHGAAANKTAGANAGGANRVHPSNLKKNTLQKGASVQGPKRPGPPKPRLPPHPQAKHPAANDKRPHQ